MTLPPGHEQEINSNLVCRLKRSIYELKQFPRVWYEKLSFFLVSYNFNISNADGSLFTKYERENTVIVLVYVDDIVITGNNQEEIKKVKLQLKDKFDIKDLGLLKYFLVIEVVTSGKDLFILQRKYTLDLLKETSTLEFKPASTPINKKCKLNTENDELLKYIK